MLTKDGSDAWKVRDTELYYLKKIVRKIDEKLSIYYSIFKTECNVYKLYY